MKMDMCSLLSPAWPTKASVSVTRVEEHACSEERAFYNLLKQQASFLNINMGPCQGCPKHTSFLETQGSQAPAETKDSGWPGVVSNVMIETFQVWWP